MARIGCLSIPELLTSLASRIESECGYSVHVCAEIEITFAHAGSVPDDFWFALQEAAIGAAIPLASFGREHTGRAQLQQYEARFSHTSPIEAASALQWLHDTLPNIASAHGVELMSFADAAREGIYSGLHWHLHLLNDEGNYCFFKQDEWLSAPLEWTLGGLLFTMPALMPYFAPSEASYLRLCSGADHIPSTQSWGGNNRSCALRLPESVVPHRHIEHRVCGADADPFASLWAILVGVHYGLVHCPELAAQCFGDANRANAPRLPLSQEEAKASHDAAEWLKDYGVMALAR